MTTVVLLLITIVLLLWWVIALVHPFDRLRFQVERHLYWKVREEYEMELDGVHIHRTRWVYRWRGRWAKKARSLL